MMFNMIFSLMWELKEKFVTLVCLLLSSFFPAKITYEMVFMWQKKLQVSLMVTILIIVDKRKLKECLKNYS